MNDQWLTRTCALMAAAGWCFIGSHENAYGQTDTSATTSEQAQAKNEPTTLAASFQKVADASAKKLPRQMLDTFQEGIEMVKATGVERSAKQVGDTAIDAQLSSWEGDPVRLSELWNDGPVVLMWYRGGW